MKRMSLKSSSGFTMIELGMVLVILGLIIGPIFAYLTVKRDRTNYQVTMEKQRKITIALSEYAQKYGYLPCPGTPTAAPLGVEVTNCRAATTAGDASRYGILPFRTLGLKQDDVLDGYGNPFTYVVARTANDIPINNPNIPPLSVLPLQIFPACYGQAASAAPRYRQWGTTALKKAYFCCRRAHETEASDRTLTVEERSNATSGGMRRVALVQGSYTNDPPVSALGQTPTPSNTQYNLRYIAYVLISHGKNGEGSYTLGRAARKAWRTAGTYERENGDPDTRLFYDMAISTKTGSDYFDDIVLWRTQESTMSETGSNSCMNP